MLKKCSICGKEINIQDEESNFYIKNKFYCSLECEYKNNNYSKISYEIKKEILNYHFLNPKISARTLSSIFKVNKDVGIALIKRYGIRLSRSELVSSKSKLNLKNEINNYTYFSKIDDENKAYFLGFIYGDGYLSENRNCLEITLKYEDKYLLDYFNNLLDNKGRVHDKISKCNGLSIKTARFYIHSKTIKNDLLKLGVHQNKSFTLKFPKENLIPENLMRHFIRGLLDSDGCIIHSRTSNGISFLGTENLLEGILSILNKKLNLNANIYKRKNIYELRKYGVKAYEVAKYLYEDSEIFLKRKYKKYENYLKQRYSPTLGETQAVI